MPKIKIVSIDLDDTLIYGGVYEFFENLGIQAKYSGGDLKEFISNVWGSSYQKRSYKRPVG